MLALIITMLLQATPAPAAGPIITNPDWAERPTGKDVSEFYPGRASQLGYAGQATLSCIVLADGHLSECKVVGEEPEGRGFGDATLKLSTTFRMKPQTRDGQPVSGGTIRIPVRFIYPGLRLAPLLATHPSLRDGHADLNCRVSESLLLENCFLEALTPRDDGLRETAMKLAIRVQGADRHPVRDTPGPADRLQDGRCAHAVGSARLTLTQASSFLAGAPRV